MELAEGKSCGSSDSVEFAAGFAFQKMLCVGGCADHQSRNSAIKGAAGPVFQVACYNERSWPVTKLGSLSA
jgi:hypothetical protein